MLFLALSLVSEREYYPVYDIICSQSRSHQEHKSNNLGIFAVAIFKTVSFLQLIDKIKAFICWFCYKIYFCHLNNLFMLFLSISINASHIMYDALLLMIIPFLISNNTNIASDNFATIRNVNYH